MISYQKQFADLLLEEVKFDSILDLGCGNGEVLRYIKEARPEVECTGVDISRMWGNYDGEINFIKGDIEKLDFFPNDSYDLVITSGVLILFDDEEAQRIMDQMVRIKKNTVAVLEFHSEEPIPFVKNRVWRNYNKFFEQPSRLKFFDIDADWEGKQAIIYEK